MIGVDVRRYSWLTVPLLSAWTSLRFAQSPAFIALGPLQLAIFPFCSSSSDMADIGRPVSVSLN